MTTTTKTVKWTGRKPSVCDIPNCGTPITNFWVDGRTTFGPWANMCPACFTKYGVGLGLGKGQKYDARTLIKVEG